MLLQSQGLNVTYQEVEAHLSLTGIVEVIMQQRVVAKEIVLCYS
jgi:hypothetical protein